RIQAENQLESIGLAMAAYHDEHESFPPAYTLGMNRTPLLSWRVLILPYLGEAKLYKRFRLDEPWDSPDNVKLLSEMPLPFRSVRDIDRQGGMTHWRVFTGTGTAFAAVGGISLGTFTDGPSNTLLVIEANEAVPWTKPEAILFGPKWPMPKLGAQF